MPHYTVAHSPDADDIFMYYAIKFGWVSEEDIHFKNEALDIETLNEAALKSQFDISAISFGLYPRIKEEYALLRTAASFGEGYGPKLIKQKGKRLKRNFKVALSGRYTTNAMLFRIRYPEARITYMNFLEIEQAVIEGHVDAGVLIHESILNFAASLEVEAEIFDIWSDLAKDNLPLPLGGMGIRRSVPLNRAITCEKLLTRAIEVGRQHQKRLSMMLMERDLIRVNASELETYLSMYANETSELLNDTSLKALDKLFAIGFEHGEYSELIHAEDFLIPSEYEGLRHS